MHEFWIIFLWVRLLEIKTKTYPRKWTMSKMSLLQYTRSYESESLCSWLYLIYPWQLTMITLIINPYYNLRNYNRIQCFLLTIKITYKPTIIFIGISLLEKKTKTYPRKRGSEKVQEVSMLSWMCWFVVIFSSPINTQSNVQQVPAWPSLLANTKRSRTTNISWNT